MFTPSYHRRGVAYHSAPEACQGGLAGKHSPIFPHVRQHTPTRANTKPSGWDLSGPEREPLAHPFDAAVSPATDDTPNHIQMCPVRDFLMELEQQVVIRPGGPGGAPVQVEEIAGPASAAFKSSLSNHSPR